MTETPAQHTPRQITAAVVVVREANLIPFIVAEKSPMKVTDAADALAAYIIAARARRTGREVINARLDQWDDDGNHTYTYTTGHPSDLTGGYTDISDSRLHVSAADTAIVDQWLTDGSVHL